MLVCTSLVAQSDRGTISGTILDSSGAVVPNASVVARSSETGSVTKTVTTTTGNYVIPELPVGVYEVSVEVPGFKKYVRNGITVQVAETARVDVSLEVGATADSILVTADASLLRTESAEQSTTLNAERLDALPLNFGSINGGSLRNLLGFAGLAPGTWVQPSTTSNSSNNNIRVNGLPNITFGLRVDGQEATGGVTPQTANVTQPSIDSMQEYTMQTSNFAAEYGNVGGGLFNFTSRSGTNQYHGSAYEYYTNEDMNAGQPFTNSGHGHLLRPKYRRNDWGESIGGPVFIPKLYNGRNKTFFFFNIEEIRNTNPNSPTQATVPTAAMRSGDFSQAVASANRNLGNDALGSAIYQNEIYDPASSQTVNGAMVRTPFPNNAIPQSRLDPVALKIQALIPQSTYGTLTNNFQQIYAITRNQDEPSAKLDHIFKDNSKLSFYFQFFHTLSTFNNGDGLPYPLSAVRMQMEGTYMERLNYDRSITPTLLFHIGVGEMRWHNPDSSPPQVLNYDAVGQLGLMGSATNPAGFPRITGLSGSFGGMSLGMGPTNANNYEMDKPTGIVNLTWIRGSHAYKLGAEWRLDLYTDAQTNGSQGSYTFSNNETAQIVNGSATVGGNSSGQYYASFLLGQADSASIVSPMDIQLRRNSWDVFLQDTWKVTRRLTLDYGVRWDLFGAQRETHDRFSGFSPTTPNPSAGGLPGGTIYEGSGPGQCNCHFVNAYPFAIGPRLGAAFQITPKTVFRAGWGLVYNSTPSGYFTTLEVGTGGWGSISFASPSTGLAAVQLSQGLQYTQAQLSGNQFSPGVAPIAGRGISGYPTYWWDPNGARPGRINQWNLSLQREVTKDLVVEAAFVGNRGAWLTAGSLIDLNGLTPQRLAQFGLNINNAADRTLLTSTMSSAAVIARGFTVPYAGFPTGSTLAQALRPYPQFTSITPNWSPLGNSWYDALQAKATQRFSHGLTLGGAFTWSQELTTAEGPYVGDLYNRGLQKELSSNSQPFITVVAFSYQIPTFLKSRLVHSVLGGWTVGGIVRYASGMPIQVPCSTNNLNNIWLRTSSCDPDNRVAGQALFTQNLNGHNFDPQKTFVLNPAAWTDPGAGNWGTSSAFYNDYRYQRRPDEQANLSRTFRLREKMSLAIRAEFFNVFNRTEPNNPSQSNIAATQVVGVSGFGYINVGSTAADHRSGQLVARFQF